MVVWFGLANCAQPQIQAVCLALIWHLALLELFAICALQGMGVNIHYIIVNPAPLTVYSVRHLFGAMEICAVILSLLQTAEPMD